MVTGMPVCSVHPTTRGAAYILTTDTFTLHKRGVRPFPGTKPTAEDALLFTTKCARVRWRGSNDMRHTSAAGGRSSAVENFCLLVVRVSRMSNFSVLSPSTTVYRNVSVSVMFPLR